jgi:AcrR family transcriptional regulator
MSPVETAKNRKPSADERRAGILEIAHQAFLRDGFSATSMSRIAAEVGGSKATLYSYFPSKKALFEAVAERESAFLIEQLFRVSPSRGDFRADLAELTRRFLTVLVSDRMISGHRLIISESGRFPEIGRAAYALTVKRGLERLSAYFQAAMDAGYVRPSSPMFAAEVFFDLAAGNLHKQRLWSVVQKVDAPTIEIEARRIASIFLAAYGSDELSADARMGR